MFHLVLLVVFVSGNRTYRESYSVTQLKHPHHTLIEFNFEIASSLTSPFIVDIFPQPIAAVLFGPNSDGLKSIQANIVRGQWKSFKWGEEDSVPIAIHPPGSSLFMTSTTSSSNSLWSKTAWMFSSLTGIAFESLCPEQDQFKWIRAHDVEIANQTVVRVGSNPNDPCCTENMDRLLELLPCRNRGGLGAVMAAMTDEFATAEFLQVSIRGEKRGQFFLHIAVVLFEYGSRIASIPVRLLRVNECPLITDKNTINDEANYPVDVIVKRSLIGTKNRPERHQGKLVVHITNKHNTENRTIEYHEQVPFFLVPLWHTQKNFETLKPKLIVPSDGRETPGKIVWRIKLQPNETVTVQLDMYKKFIPNYHSTFGFEKGFDLSGSVVHVVETNQVFLTRGLITVIPLGDGSAVFNFLAVGCTAVALFFGFVFRFFYAKRSVVGGTDEVALAERQPPIVKIIKFIISRTQSIIAAVRSRSRVKSD